MTTVVRVRQDTVVRTVDAPADTVAAGGRAITTIVRVTGVEQAGPQGVPGPQGDLGPTGLSAYEVALLEGFVGTEQEWLDSLVGPQGAPGEAGQPGGYYQHDFQAADFVDGVLTVVHNLGYRPGGIFVEDSLGNDVEGTVDHVDATTTTFYFNGFTFGGRVLLS